MPLNARQCYLVFFGFMICLILKNISMINPAFSNRAENLQVLTRALSGDILTCTVTNAYNEKHLEFALVVDNNNTKRQLLSGTVVTQGNASSVSNLPYNRFQGCETMLSYFPEQKHGERDIMIGAILMGTYSP